MSTMRSFCWFVSLLGASTAAQQSDPLVAPVSQQVRLEDAFLAARRLPERIEVNGRILVVADLVRAAREADVPDERVARCCLDRVVLTILQDRLVQTKAWLDDAAHEAAYAKYAEPYDTTPFTVEVIATRFKGYPSLADFRQRWRIVEAVRQSLPATAFDERALAAEAERSRDLLDGNGIEVELWFHPAAAGAFGQRDFAAATKQAAATRAALVAATGREPELPAGVERRHLGDEGRPLTVNQLRQALRETEYTTWLREGVADVLFRAPAGELSQPLRGSDGVYVARLVRKVESKRRIDLKLEGARDLARQLLVDRLAREWVATAFEHAVVRVTPDRAPETGR